MQHDVELVDDRRRRRQERELAYSSVADMFWGQEEAPILGSRDRSEPYLNNSKDLSPRPRNAPALFQWEDHVGAKAPPRIGNNSGVWNFRRPPIAKRGYVSSNLPSLEGVRGLGQLNTSCGNEIPRETVHLHPTSRIHPTFLSAQQSR